jgi:hypothetical protein
VNLTSDRSTASLAYRIRRGQPPNSAANGLSNGSNGFGKVAFGFCDVAIRDHLDTESTCARSNAPGGSLVDP